MSGTVAYFHLEMMKEAKMLNARSDSKGVIYMLNEAYFNNVINQINKPIKLNQANKKMTFGNNKFLL